MENNVKDDIWNSNMNGLGYFYTSSTMLVYYVPFIYPHTSTGKTDKQVT